MPPIDAKNLSLSRIERCSGSLPAETSQTLNDLLLRNAADLAWPPQPGPQADFVRGAADVDIVIYGGSAGGGKTVGLLLDPLKYADNPEFQFVIFRRTSPQITNQGGLWDESSKIYPACRATPVKGRLEWTFPKSARGTFRHLQYEDTVDDWQGAQVPWIGFDELTHFTKHQFFYMLSRNRSTSGVRGRIRATTNPAPGWVRQFLAPWVDREFTDPAVSGAVRWFIRVDDEIVWVDEDYRDADGDGPLSMTFIRSSVYDNKIRMEKDPGYVSRLKALSPIQRARLLDGDWDIMEGNYFTNWSETRHVRRPGEDDRAPDPVPAWYKFFGGLDYGRLAPFCFLLMAADDAGSVIVFDEIYEARLEPSEQAAKIVAMLERYGLGPRQVMIYCDPSIFPGKPASAPVGGRTLTPGWSMTANNGRHISDFYYEAGLNVVTASSANTEKERINGGAIVREYLLKEGALTVYKGRCPNLIRTIAAIPVDPNEPEAYDTSAEDHAVDALRFALRNRGLKGTNPDGEKPPASPPDYRPAWMKQPRHRGPAGQSWG